MHTPFVKRADLCFKNATYTIHPHPRKPIHRPFVGGDAKDIGGGHGVLRKEDQADSCGELL